MSDWVLKVGEHPSQGKQQKKLCKCFLANFFGKIVPMICDKTNPASQIRKRFNGFFRKQQKKKKKKKKERRDHT